MIRVLLVDDHKLIRVGLGKLLEAEAGIEVVGEAADGETALQLARELAPDVVVLDINMPGMNGVEATRRLTRLEPAPRILIVSMHSQDPVPARLLEAGAAGYLTKDAAADEIVAAVRQVHAGKRFLSADIAREIALGNVGGSPLAKLSDRELEVMLLVANGYGIPEIAERLHLSPKTVATYRYRLFDKLDLRNDVELARYALRHGLLEDVPV
ncbi:MAG TPA: response regulator [Gammaproteobacteria bacterium]|nr:response regulator [Gammaproteobacteria bacterium]